MIPTLSILLLISILIFPEAAFAFLQCILDDPKVGIRYPVLIISILIMLSPMILIIILQQILT